MLRDLLPILSTLRRHKTAALLIVFEIALACAIVSNALHLIAQRLDGLQTRTGLAESELVVLSVGGVGATLDTNALTARDLAALRALPGVRAVTLANQVPFGNNSNNTSLGRQPDARDADTGAAAYILDGSGLQTLGLELTAGRDFLPEEVQRMSELLTRAKPTMPSLIVNQAVADKLFPGESAVGKTIYLAGMSGAPSTIVGVVRELSITHPERGPKARQQAFINPVLQDYRNGVYVLRTTPEQRDAVAQAARAAIEAIDARRIVIDVKSLSDMRADFYAQDRAMVGLLAGVCVALLVVTALGIVGLASFWVQQRQRMIGTRRALGATAGQILGYFRLENFLLSSAGIALGVAGAWVLSLVLMRQAELPPLPWVYLPVSAIVLWLLGQIAVWGPARRAAALPPVAALRS